MLAKVVKVLRSGSHVLPTIYPRILPLINAIPLIDAKDYVVEVLGAIREGKIIHGLLNIWISLDSLTKVRGSVM